MHCRKLGGQREGTPSSSRLGIASMSRTGLSKSKEASKEKRKLQRKTHHNPNFRRKVDKAETDSQTIFIWGAIGKREPDAG